MDAINNTEFFFDILLSVVSQLCWYFTVRQFTDKSEKRSSWILTLLPSIILSVACIPNTIEGMKSGWRSEHLYYEDRMSTFLTRFFTCYLILDTIIMFFHFPSIGGLPHHSGYFILFATCLIYHCPSVVMAFFPLEFSSIFLASGTIWPEFRQDLIFGISFFVLRVVYHFYLWLRLYQTRDDSPVLFWPFAILPWFMHVYWFVKWFISQMKKRNKNKGSPKIIEETKAD